MNMFGFYDGVFMGACAAHILWMLSFVVKANIDHSIQLKAKEYIVKYKEHEVRNDKHKRQDK